nr:MAG TPA: hypothetical protein [Caudoviricetes sp.]
MQDVSFQTLCGRDLAASFSRVWGTERSVNESVG